MTKARLGATGYTPTDRRYTGQIFDDATSLYFYNARYYDPVLSRFIQADTLVPDPTSPQSFNRYAYTLNNPLRYTDPSGHFSEEEIENYLKENYGQEWQAYWDAWQADPYWMWILYNATPNSVLTFDLSVAGIGGNTVVFQAKRGSFKLEGGHKLHRIQGRGVYQLFVPTRPGELTAIIDYHWTGFGRTTGTLGALEIGPVVRGGYYQPLYDYSSGRPVFRTWRHIQVNWSTEVNFNASSAVPFFIERLVGRSGVPAALKKATVIWAGMTVVDGLTTNTANRVTYRYVSWPPQDRRRLQNNFLNPNGLGYPAPPR